MPLRLVVRIVDPTLPRDGTDLITTASRGAYRRPDANRVTVLMTSSPRESRDASLDPPEPSSECHEVSTVTR
jgi:hypothetical protein